MSKSDRFQLVGNTIASTFRVDEVVAEGGFGVVYRAFHLHFRSSVALKCLKIPSELSAEERTSFLEQFRSEAEIQFRLSAVLPNIVRPLHVDAVHTDQGEFVPIMALEWLDGRTLEKIIDERSLAELPPLSLAEAMDLIGPAAQALHEAHNFETEGEQISVVHRDIKPDNLFVTEMAGKKTVKLLDFGISKVRRAATQLAGHVSQTGGYAPFSPAYGAPEQWVPKRFGQTGPWTDVWGLALTLVEIIKGDAVIDGDHQAMMGTALDPKVRPSPRSEGIKVSDEVESVFLKALAVDPRYRYQSVKTFWEALGAALSRDLSQGHQETPSGHRIPLPKMSAPTPWTPPHLKLRHEPSDVGHLPPMLAPAPMVPTPDSDLKEASYPSNPNSDLHPVPPAPTPFSELEAIDIPPMFGPEGDVPSSRAAGRAPRRRLSSRPRHASVGSLELMPTSNFPPAVDEGMLPKTGPSARALVPTIDLHDVTPPIPTAPIPTAPITPAPITNAPIPTALVSTAAISPQAAPIPISSGTVAKGTITSGTSGLPSRGKPAQKQPAPSTLPSIPPLISPAPPPPPSRNKKAAPSAPSEARSVSVPQPRSLPRPPAPPQRKSATGSAADPKLK